MCISVLLLFLYILKHWILNVLTTTLPTFFPSRGTTSNYTAADFHFYVTKCETLSKLPSLVLIIISLNIVMLVSKNMVTWNSQNLTC